MTRLDASSGLSGLIVVFDFLNALRPATITANPASTKQPDTPNWILSGMLNDPNGTSSDHAIMMPANARATIGGGILVFTALLYRSTKIVHSKAFDRFQMTSLHTVKSRDNHSSGEVELLR
jgi:hypothetical protein